eukprot:CAMPEP_0177669122 /NCGR_PEP_ID=MMETSP0447-20121125/23242_1 /TAXON_ID=0 /ORGANISM="Stygamoeba regulata, Strain BSH-02190019" /LENGTH=79 /DNA_ID=CAMNT_0019175907 /DNA_START=189 /DNA_END=425 /DNA_ORIENTATION=-
MAKATSNPFETSAGQSPLTATNPFVLLDSDSHEVTVLQESDKCVGNAEMCVLTVMDGDSGDSTESETSEETVKEEEEEQ